MNTNDIKPYYLYKRNNKCEQCGITSNSVNHSKKFNKSLCLDCLKQAILDKE